jgi:5'-3' exoribonuclease 1
VSTSALPTFGKWIAEAKTALIVRLDTFYLDLNGIIRNCAYPMDGDVQLQMDESQIFADICNYVDHLFQLVQPRRYCFLAIDGGCKGSRCRLDESEPWPETMILT